jgi:hypothetical protein
LTWWKKAKATGWVVVFIGGRFESGVGEVGAYDHYTRVMKIGVDSNVTLPLSLPTIQLTRLEAHPVKYKIITNDSAWQKEACDVNPSGAYIIILLFYYIINRISYILDLHDVSLGACSHR